MARDRAAPYHQGMDQACGVRFYARELHDQLTAGRASAGRAVTMGEGQPIQQAIATVD